MFITINWNARDKNDISCKRKNAKQKEKYKTSYWKAYTEILITTF